MSRHIGLVQFENNIKKNIVGTVLLILSSFIIMAQQLSQVRSIQDVSVGLGLSLACSR